MIDLTYLAPGRPGLLIPATEIIYNHSTKELSNARVTVEAPYRASIATDALFDLSSAYWGLGKHQISSVRHSAYSSIYELVAVPHWSDIKDISQNWNFSNIKLDATLNSLMEGWGIDWKLIVPAVNVNYTGTESSYSVVRTLLSRFGLNMVVEDGKITIADEKFLNDRPPAATFTPENIRIKELSDNSNYAYWAIDYTYNWLGGSKTVRVMDVFKSLKVLTLKKILSYTSTTLIETPIEAFFQAYKQLQKANNQSFTGSLVVLGDKKFHSLNNIALSGFDILDGKYRILEAEHNWSGSEIYKTTLSVERIFERESGWSYEDYANLLLSGAVNLFTGLPGLLSWT